MAKKIKGGKFIVSKESTERENGPSSDQDIALEILGQYNDIRTRMQTRLELEKKCLAYINNYVDGNHGQWKTETRKELTAQGRPANSFNNIKKFVNRLCGAQSALRLDEKVLPDNDDATPLVADVLADCVKSVKERNKADLAIRKMFRDGVITSRGFVKTEWSDELDPLGEIVIKAIPPHRVFIIGEGEEYDISRDRRGIIEVIPMDKDVMKARWPDHADEIDEMTEKCEREEDIPVAATYDYGYGLTIPTNIIYDRKDKKLYVLRRQYVKYKSVEIFQDDKTGAFSTPPEDANDRKIALELAEQAGVKINRIKKAVRSIEVTYIVGTVHLETNPSPYKHGEFDITNFYCYTDDGLTTGVVQDLLDPQDEKNKRRSQAIHILGTAAKNSYFAKKGAFDDINKARTEFGKTGNIIEVNGNPKEAVTPIESNMQAVPALVQMETMSEEDMKSISGITDASLGITPEGVKSGRGIHALQVPVESIIAEIRDNLFYSRQMIFKKVLALIQQYYTTERRIRITGDYLAKAQPPDVVAMKQQIKDQAMAMGVDEAQAILTAESMVEVVDGTKTLTINRKILDKKLMDVSAGKYRMEIDEVSANPTQRQQQYQDMLNMRALGAPIGWDKIIKYSDIRGKTEILADMEAEAMKMQMEAMMMQSAKKTATPPQGGGAPGGGPADEMLNSAGGQF